MEGLYSLELFTKITQSYGESLAYCIWANRIPLFFVVQITNRSIYTGSEGQNIELAVCVLVSCFPSDLFRALGDDSHQ